MRYFIKIALSLLVVLQMVGCKSQYDALLKSNDVDAKYKGAFEYFNRGKYSRAVELFDQLQLATRGTSKDDTVQFYLGLSNFKYGDYTIAEANFDNFISYFPRSPFTQEAKYLRIECLYRSTYRFELDQQPTHKALSAIDVFMYEYPTSKYDEKIKFMVEDLQERLDRKSYEAARLYYIMEDYKAASYALKTALKDNSDNQYREHIVYYIVASNYQYAINSIRSRQRDRFLALVDEYYNFISEYPESSYRAEVDKMFTRAQEFLNR